MTSIASVAVLAGFSVPNAQMMSSGARLLLSFYTHTHQITLQTTLNVETYWNSKRELWLGTGKRNSGHVRRRLPRWVAVHGWHDLRWGHALRERDGAI